MRPGLGDDARRSAALAVLDVALLAALTLLVRSRSFVYELSDGNVGLYYHVANQWLSGAPPYTATWEYKPPGIFALLALSLRAAGDPTISQAILGSLATFASAWLLMALAKTSLPRWGSVAAGVFFITLSSENEGLSADVELLMTPFLTAALYFVTVPTRPRWIACTCCGLSVGLALQLSLMALPVSCFAALAAVVRAGTPSVLLGFVLAAAAPFAVEAFAFERAHAFAAFYDANVGATLRRAQHRPDRFGRAPLGSVVDQFRILAPPLQLAFLSPLAQRSRLLWVSAGWLAAAAAGIAVTGEFYARQFVLVHAPLSLLGAIGATALATRLDRKRLVMTLALLTAFAMHDYYNARVNLQMAYAKYAHRKAPSASDPFAEGRARLKAIVGLHSLYIINESPLLYDELNATSPTRYPLSADLLERNMWAMLGFSGERELDRVLNQRPAFVLVGAQGARDDAATYAAFMQRLQQEYEFREALSIGRLYRLRADSRLSRSSIQ